ncbi:MAG: hypothetical protein LKJ05_01235 [Bifidobacteriaceae bacterium]|jgi:hypothetical protein|nr:hypothetical protein [Bifidobacteriaceae bacterium]
MATKNSQRSEQAKRLYRRRRIVAGVALVAALALVITFIWAFGKSVGSVKTAAYNYLHRDELTSLQRKEVPDILDGSGVSDCTGDQLSLKLTADTTTVASGGAISFNALLQHDGGASCLIDASESSRVLTITSGKQKIWSSASCTASPRTLLMTNDEKDAQTVTWNTTSGSSACNAGASTPAKAGTYVAKLSLRDVPDVTSDPLTFQVTDGSAATQ